MSRLEYVILSVLASEGATNRRRAMTLKEIYEIDNLGYKINTMSKLLRKLEDLKVVGTGYKDGNSNTYYITDIGIAFLNEE